MVQLAAGVQILIPTGIGLKLPENMVGIISGTNIKEISITEEIDLIKVTYIATGMKSIKPNELLAEIEFIPKKSELTFKVERKENGSNI